MRLSPAITPTVYRRPSDKESSPVSKEVYRLVSVDEGSADEMPETTITEEGIVVYHGELGEVIITNCRFHVNESVYRTTKMVFVREYVADVMEMMAEKGAIEYEIE